MEKKPQKNRVSTFISDSLHKDLKAFALLNHWSVSKAIEILLTEQLKKEQWTE